MRIRISEARKSLGISQKDLAERIGVSPPYLAQLENGTRNLSIKNQRIIASALGVPADDLVDFDAPDQGDEDAIIHAFRKLTPEQRRNWLDMARVMAGEPKE